VRIIGRHDASGGVPVVLGQQLTRRVKVGKRRFITQRLVVQVPPINGGFAGVAVRNFDSLGRGRTTIRVVDLVTGATTFTSRQTAGSGAARQWSVTDLALSSDGRAGWITVYRPDPSQSQVIIRTFAAVQSIDSGTIDPLSLEETELVDESGALDASVDYTKDGGTAIGNSSLG
jgi:hypothetical protein